MLDEKAFRLIHAKPSLRKKNIEVSTSKKITYEESVEIIYQIIKNNKGIIRSEIREITSKSYHYISSRTRHLINTGRVKCKLITCGNSNKTHSYVAVQG